MKKLVGRVWEEVASFSASVKDERMQTLFHSAKEDGLRAYKNSWFQPRRHAEKLRLALMSPSDHTADILHDALAPMTLDDLSKFSRDLLASIRVEGLISGNMDDGDVRAILAMIQTTFGSDHLCHGPSTPRPYRVANIDKQYHCIESCTDPENNNTNIQVYYPLFPQLPDKEIESPCLMDLFNDIMFEPLFDELRTKQQLGYSVGCGTRDTYGTLSWCVYIDCPNIELTPSDLLQRVFTFLKGYRKTLTDMTEEEFSTKIRSTALNKLEPPNCVGDKHCLSWGPISTQKYVFKRDRLAARYLATVTKAQIEEIYDKILACEKLLFVGVIPQKVSKSKDADATKTPLKNALSQYQKMMPDSLYVQRGHVFEWVKYVDPRALETGKSGHKI